MLDKTGLIRSSSAETKQFIYDFPYNHTDMITALGSAVCEGCAAGSFSDKNGTTSCNLCNKGSFSSGNATMCNLCSAGSVSEKDGAVECSLCEAGYSTDGLRGASDCQPCSAGIMFYFIQVVIIQFKSIQIILFFALLKLIIAGWNIEV